ncbi:hypothetical protein ACLKA7_007281 [Drosophila subpalustris]
MLANWYPAAVLTLCLLHVCRAQLSFHTDANSNSFTLKTPGLQQSFTRYYGAAKQQQPPQQQQQPELPQTQLQSADEQQQQQEQEQLQLQLQQQQLVSCRITQ